MSLPEPVTPEQLPLPLLRDKLTNLVAQVRGSLGVEPTSFRTGRFEVGPKALGLLPEFGFKVDSSVVPLTLKGGGDYFLAPADPFRLRAGSRRGARLAGGAPDPGAADNSPGPAGVTVPRLPRPLPAALLQVRGRRRRPAGLVFPALHAPGRGPPPPSGRPGAHHVLSFLGAETRGQPPSSPARRRWRASSPRFGPSWTGWSGAARWRACSLRALSGVGCRLNCSSPPRDAHGNRSPHASPGHGR